MRSGTRRIGRFTARKRRSAGNKLIGANWRTERADAVFQRFMAEKKKFQAIKGTRDLLPPETELWNRVEQTARKVFGTFGFGEIRPPIFEPTELFARAVGGETDIVSKEMYSFPDNPDLGHIEELKAQLLEMFVFYKESDYAGFFVHGVENFLQSIEQRSQRGELSVGSEAQSDLDKLRHIFARLPRSDWTSVPSEIDQETRDIIAQISLKVQMFRFSDSVALRPEATASVCRGYIEHGMQQLPQPVKLYYMGPMFRRERPQKGRYRQFYQIGAEVLEREGASGELRVASKEGKEVTSSPTQAGVASKELAKDAAVD